MVEEFKYGKFSLTDAERKAAEEGGTLAKAEERMKKATETLRVGQSEEAIKQLEKAAAEQGQEERKAA